MSEVVKWRMREVDGKPVPFLAILVENLETMDRAMTEARARDGKECKLFFDFMEKNLIGQEMSELRDALVQDGMDMPEVGDLDNYPSLVSAVLSMWPEYAEEGGIPIDDLNRAFGVDISEGWVFFGEEMMSGRMCVATV